MVVPGKLPVRNVTYICLIKRQMYAPTLQSTSVAGHSKNSLRENVGQRPGSRDVRALMLIVLLIFESVGACDKRRKESRLPSHVVSAQFYLFCVLELNYPHSLKVSFKGADACTHLAFGPVQYVADNLEGGHQAYSKKHIIIHGITQVSSGTEF